MLLRCHHPACIDTPTACQYTTLTSRQRCMYTFPSSKSRHYSYHSMCFYLSQARLSTRMRILLPESSEIINPYANTSTWIKRDYQPTCESLYLNQVRLSTRMRILQPESSEIINPHADPSTWVKHLFNVYVHLISVYLSGTRCVYHNSV